MKKFDFQNKNTFTEDDIEKEAHTCCFSLKEVRMILAYCIAERTRFPNNRYVCYNLICSFMRSIEKLPPEYMDLNGEELFKKLINIYENDI